MGLIADRLDEVRNDPGWLTRGDNDDATTTPSGMRVNRASALSLSTVWACWSMISHDVSLSEPGVVVKVGGRSFPEYRNVPSWLTTPNPADPNYMIGDHFGECALSMLADGNFFTAVLPYVWQPEVLTVLDPGRVVVREGPLYDILDANGSVSMTLSPMQMLHGWWMKLPGQRRGISPLEAQRRGIGSALAADEFAGRFFGQGASLAFGVEVPGSLTEPQKVEMRDALKRRHQGLSNSHAIGLLTQGAKFVTGLAPTPEQAQMLATRKFGVEEIARIYHVPPGMVGSQEPGASSYASAVEWRKQYRQAAVLPFAAKIERQYGRLLAIPSGLADTTATATLHFDLDWIDRVDQKTRYEGYEVAIRGGFRTPNAVRADEGEAPMEGGDRLYMQSQMVPIGDLGMTKNTEPAAGQSPAGRSEPVQVNVGINADAVRVAAPEVIVPAPVVNVPAPIVNLPAPVVHVAPPDMEPVMAGLRELRDHFDAPVTKTIDRDNVGRITAIHETRADVPSTTKEG